MPPLLAGACELEITPPLDVPLGSGFNPPQVIGVADPLYTRALVFAQGSERVALTCSDILAVDPQLARDVRERVSTRTRIPADHVMIAATHTHSCGGRLQPSRGNGDPVLIEMLARQIASAVAVAEQRLAPASLAVGAAPVHGVSQNRRDPDAPIDQMLRVLRVDGRDGLLAALTTFACHPTLVGHDRPVLSADFPGVLVRTIQAVCGGTVVVLPTNGACGDVNPIAAGADGLEAARWVGQILGSTAAAVLARLHPAGQTLRADNTRWGLSLLVEADTGVRIVRPMLGAASAIIHVPYKQFESAEVATSAAAEAARRLAEAGVDDVTLARWQEGRPVPAEEEARAPLPAREARRRFASELLRRRSEVWAARVAALQGIVGASSRAIELQAIRLGAEAALLAVPFELFSRVGLDIHAENPFPHLFLIGYTNDLGGYLMPDDEHARGGFEAGITFYGPGAADAVRTGALALLRTLAAGAAGRG
ncbi:MAG TPA: neutral/alkaline non-lysosomal ceramidase N-terminal domain-containing protein [bacterium]|nr:neutral/alkaline non-lysosomal ceramidase N-terminal domain-containing protein [bacterium]